MRTALQISLIVVSLLLIAAVLLQSRGAGLGAVFGGEGNVYRTKRGVEKIVFRATVALSAAFLLLALLNSFLPA
ncbi:preprotein translocase subunit SecG [Candidatus Uhrbacteria bacterium RIFCSPHIGHO2_12_FULL_57_11]|uniref:Protein-export membrane protein SecG n=2 Tax=Candidatus Uhriibacteriota TaxID=1752732 RepID=A0A1F7UI06_9BACT|nr:MAG: preprotein translocase subunit SecG [Candidatus Uhrbacteria bacterium RIFCSPHIGHO2_02_FULL_57_19]OGL77911.1 MAG: preprotein translocase subunit SecG [Candidatus Uhrbacteria bacterium RIFCSPHIGHO2_12_FULL_57_11]